jgi:hypothetical protein
MMIRGASVVAGGAGPPVTRWKSRPDRFCTRSGADRVLVSQAFADRAGARHRGLVLNVRRPRHPVSPWER